MVTILGMGRGKHMECNNVKEKEGNILIDAALKLIVLWFACLILKKIMNVEHSKLFWI